MSWFTRLFGQGMKRLDASAPPKASRASAICRFCGRSLSAAPPSVDPATYNGRVFIRCAQCGDTFHQPCAAGQEECPTCGPGKGRHWTLHFG